MASEVSSKPTAKKKSPYMKKPAGESLPAWQSFLFSTIAPQLAVLFTNPFDTAKVCLLVSISHSYFRSSKTMHRLELKIAVSIVGPGRLVIS